MITFKRITSAMGQTFLVGEIDGLERDVPTVEENRHYQDILKMVERGEAKIVPPLHAGNGNE